jgi:hypothetical protein
MSEKKNRSQEAVKVASPSRVQRARKSGPIGSQIDSQGNNNSTPKTHPPPNGGAGGIK